MVSHHPAKFDSHGHRGSGDMVLVCHVISQDDVMKGLCNLLGRIFSW